MTGELDGGGVEQSAAQLARRERVLDRLWAFEISAAIGAVARLGVADVLAVGPLSAADIGSRVGADAGSLERVLRSLIEPGLFERLADGRFALTADGELLRGDVPESVRANAIYATEEWHWRAYGHVTHSLRTGEPGFVAAHGGGLWQYLESHPEAAAVFHRAMGKSAESRGAKFAAGFDFSGIRRLVDVGGGGGALIQTVLEAHPHMRAVAFDLPGALAGAEQRLAAAGLAERCELVPGDFFDAVPAGGDAYVLSYVIHDWQDREALRILSNVRRAVGEGGRLLLIEMVLPEDDPTHPAANVDLTMLVVAGGRERTEAEYRQLYAGAGFELTRVLPLGPRSWSVVEGTPV